MVQQRHTNVIFRETKSLRSYMPHTKVGKNMLFDIIYLDFIDLIIYLVVSAEHSPDHADSTFALLFQPPLMRSAHLMYQETAFAMCCHTSY